MKTLLLMRHAKADWKDHKLPDIERPLNQRGHLTATQIGTTLRDKELVPQLILSSSATRASQTAEIVAKGAEHAGEIQYLSSFYLAEPEVYLGALSVLSDDVERVMVVGHNPGLEGLLQILTQRIESLSAGSVAFISLPLRSWRNLNAEVEGELIELIVATKPEKEMQVKDKDMLKDKKDEKKSEKKSGDKGDKKKGKNK